MSSSPFFYTEREDRERVENEQREEEEREYQERLRKLEEQEKKQLARQLEIEERERRREEEKRIPTEEKAKVNICFCFSWHTVDYYTSMKGGGITSNWFKMFYFTAFWNVYESFWCKMSNAYTCVYILQLNDSFLYNNNLSQ